jgi:hypothetical protein
MCGPAIDTNANVQCCVAQEKVNDAASNQISGTEVVKSESIEAGTGVVTSSISDANLGHHAGNQGESTKQIAYILWFKELMLNVMGACFSFCILVT